MNVEKFLAHHNINENPFGAEEARHDPVFDRLVGQADQNHPDFSKILGRIDRPSTSVVFGEKGSGKTAIRLVTEKLVEKHNTDHPENRILLVAYDDLNPVLDEVVHRRGKRDVPAGGAPAFSREGNILNCVRLEDHQDAILSLAVTRLVSSLTQRGDEKTMQLPDNVDKRLKQMPFRQRMDLAVLSAAYDKPLTGSVVDRWFKLRSKLKLGWQPSISMTRFFALVFTLLALGLLATPTLMEWFTDSSREDHWWMHISAAVSGALAVILWIMWAWRHMKLWLLCRRVCSETPAVNRRPERLRRILMNMKRADISDQPWPVRSTTDNNSRYHLTAKFMEVLRQLDYKGMIVLVDRVDEPTLVSGQTDRMRAVVWPMFDNKFLQQDGIGFKLLLPLELSHLLHRESGEFFQEARLDKQNLVDPLTWSGATLYDLCSARLSACRPEDTDPVFLTDLFDPDVSREMLVEALDQMHQPRDAFKFLYQVILEHCRNVPEDQAKFTIPRLTLEAVRRQQSQRVQEFYRGLSPA